MMRMAGFFPSVPAQVNFELAFAPVNGNGGCLEFRVDRTTAPAAPASPEAKQPPPPAQKNGAPPSNQQNSSVSMLPSRAEIHERAVRHALLHLGGDDELCASIFSMTCDAMHLGLGCTLHLHSESLIPRGRNVIVRKFLAEEQFTHLFWIDSDIAFSADSVWRSCAPTATSSPASIR